MLHKHRLIVSFDRVALESLTCLCKFVFLFVCPSINPPNHPAMEAIKKKMASIKIEKDNAMDRADTAESKLREANSRVAKVRTPFEERLDFYSRIRVSGRRRDYDFGEKIHSNSRGAGPCYSKPCQCQWRVGSERESSSHCKCLRDVDFRKQPASLGPQIVLLREVFESFG